MGKGGFVLLPGGVSSLDASGYPWVWKRNSENHPRMGIPIPTFIPILGFRSKSCQERLKNTPNPPQLSHAAPRNHSHPHPNSRPVQKKAGKGRQRSQNPWNQTFGSSLLSWARASSASQLSPGPARFRRGQKSPGWSQLLGWPGINPWGALAAGSRGWQQEMAAWDVQNQVLKDVRGKSALENVQVWCWVWKNSWGSSAEFQLLWE